MGINPYSSYRNFSQNSINDYGSELRRQLETRQAQLSKLNTKEVLSDDQLTRKKDLEQTVSLLQKKLDKHMGIEVSKSKEVLPATKEFDEGRVISKSAYPKTPYNTPTASSNSYLKGFFFDTRI